MRIKHSLHTLSREQQVKALNALAGSCGLTLEVKNHGPHCGHRAEVHKAASELPDEEGFGERYMADLLDLADDRFQGLAQRAIERVGHQLQRGQISLPLWAKASDREAMARQIAWAVRDRLQSLGVPPSAAVEALLSGLRVLNGDRHLKMVPIIEAAWRLGRFCRSIGPQMSFDDAWAVVGARPLDPVEQAAMAFVQGRGHTFLANVAEQPLQSFPKAILAEHQMVKGAVITAIQDGHHPHEAARAMAAITRAADPWSRDWMRVARTELAHAMSHGHLIADLIEHPSNADRGPDDPIHIPNELVFKIPQAVRRDEVGRLIAPCKHCRRIWYADDQTPKLYPLKEILANGENLGRKAADLVATVGPTHPNDLCGPLQFFTEATLEIFPGMRKQLDPKRAPSQPS